MLPRKRRLKKEFIGKILRQGKSIRGTGVSLRYLVGSGQPSVFGLIVSLKTAKQAAVRNKLKRRGRAIVSNLLPNMKEGYLTLIFLEKDSPEMAFNDLENEITRLFKKARVLN